MLEFTLADNQLVNEIVNIQMFAEGDAPVSAPAEPASPAPVTSEPAAAPAQPPETQSLRDFLSSRMASTQETTPPVAPTPQPGDGGSPTPDPVPPKVDEPQVEIPDKFKNPDGSVNVEAMAKSYLNMESMYSRQVPQIQQTTQQINELQQTIIGLQNKMAENTTATNAVTQELSPEELAAKIEADNEAFWEKYNANPKEALADLIKDSMKEMVEPILAPIKADQEFQKKTEEFGLKMVEFAKDTPDFWDFQDAMVNISRRFPALEQLPDAVKVIYGLAKGMQPAGESQQPAQPAPAPTTEELLKQPDFVAKILQDPNIKTQILQQHMADIKANPAPPVISGNGGLPPSTQPVDMKNPKTAKEAFKEKYRGFFSS